ncbi:hypothetical protein [Nostoc sp. TCL240-02]|nr:hypothetical protein [Nostoc sp. TCL240-02]
MCYQALLACLMEYEESTVTIDLTEYLIPPVEQILGILVWMIRSQAT